LIGCEVSPEGSTTRNCETTVRTRRAGRIARTGIVRSLFRFQGAVADEAGAVTRSFPVEPTLALGAPKPPGGVEPEHTQAATGLRERGRRCQSPPPAAPKDRGRDKST